MIVLVKILFALFAGYVGYKWYINLRITQKLSWLPSVSGWPILGNALEFADPNKFLDNLEKLIPKKEKSVLLKLGFRPHIFTVDYEFIEFLLSSQTILTKSSNYLPFINWIGTGLLTSDGLKWKRRRRILTPAFHFSILKQFNDVFESNSNILIEKLNKVANKESIDIYKYITLYALDVICETAMGFQPNAQQHEDSKYVKNVQFMCKIVIDRLTSFIKKQVDELGRTKKLAFLDILLKSTENGELFSREAIREEVDTFMFEGHDTTASAMTFCTYLLSKHPDVQKRVLEEQKHIFENDILRPSTYKDLQEMKYLECVIKESLRTFTTVPIFGRYTTEDVYYKGNLIPKGTDITIFNFGYHHQPDNFPNPEKFDPLRFEDTSGKRPYDFIPFSAGPRNCIGQKFAMLEMKSTLSILVRNFEIFPDNDHKLILVSEAVLRSTNGVRVKLAKRIWKN